MIWNGKGLEERGIDKNTGKVLVELSSEFFRSAEIDIWIGDPSKAKKRLGWKPKTRFDELVRIMVEADIKRIERGI